MREQAKSENIPCSAQDMEKLSVAINPSDQHTPPDRLGLFFSHMILFGNDKEYRIRTAHWDLCPSYLGRHIDKNLVVDGDVGGHFGHEAGSYGSPNPVIIVNGNAGYAAGSGLNGASITIKGNAGNSLGNNMLCGVITVKGNAGYSVGGGMIRGFIFIEGELETISDNITGGKIYHKGKLVFPK